MEKLLLNFVVFSFLFVFFAARGHERISLALAFRLAVVGALLIGMAGALGAVFGQSLRHTYFILDRTNDMAMGVILGASAFYMAGLCVVWVLSSRVVKTA